MNSDDAYEVDITVGKTDISDLKFLIVNSLMNVDSLSSIVVLRWLTSFPVLH